MHLQFRAALGCSRSRCNNEGVGWQERESSLFKYRYRNTCTSHASPSGEKTRLRNELILRKMLEIWLQISGVGVETPACSVTCVYLELGSEGERLKRLCDLH